MVVDGIVNKCFWVWTYKSYGREREWPKLNFKGESIFFFKKKGPKFGIQLEVDL